MPLKHLESYIQFMARRDNRPENYHTWKASFENMVRDVNNTVSETLTLLIENTTGQRVKETCSAPVQCLCRES